MKGVALVLTVAAVACRARSSDLIGSGVEKTEARQIAGFHKLRVGDAIDAEVVVGPPAQATLVGDDNLLHGVSLELDGDVLDVHSKPGTRPKLSVRVRLTTPKLDWIIAEGASVVHVGKLGANSIRLFTGGAARLVLQGAAEEVTIRSRMASSVDARQLSAKTVHIDGQDAAQVFVGYSERLDVHITGAGRVTYQGDPELTRDVSRLGSLIADR